MCSPAATKVIGAMTAAAPVASISSAVASSPVSVPLVINNQMAKQAEGAANQQKEAAKQAAEAAAKAGPAPVPDAGLDQAQTAADRNRRLQALRYGIASTIKTSPLGLLMPATVNSPSATPAGGKTALGQ